MRYQDVSSNQQTDNYIYEDNQSCKKFVENGNQSNRTKHISHNCCYFELSHCWRFFVITRGRTSHFQVVAFAVAHHFFRSGTRERDNVFSKQCLHWHGSRQFEMFIRLHSISLTHSLTLYLYINRCVLHVQFVFCSSLCVFFLSIDHPKHTTLPSLFCALNLYGII